MRHHHHHLFFAKRMFVSISHAIRSPFTFLISCLLTLISFSSCDPDRIYESNIVLPAEGWRSAGRVRFEVEITDTITPCNIYINVRNNSNYKYMGIWLFVDVNASSGFAERDTVEIMLADHRGKWLGHGLGSKFDTRMVFRKNVRFPVSGKYVFEYEQAMRDETLTGIDDIGLRIEKNVKP